MPSLDERESRVERELGYRRGYVHGVADTISAVVECLSDAQRHQLEAWVANELTPWTTGRGANEPPIFPEF
jgi:hypothetical protein